MTVLFTRLVPGLVLSALAFDVWKERLDDVCRVRMKVVKSSEKERCG
jgi:hypothetical protein